MVLFYLGKHFSKSKFIGIDVCPDAVVEGQKGLKGKNLTNVSFEVHDAANLPKEWTDKFQWLMMFDSFHDMPYSEKVLLFAI